MGADEKRSDYKLGKAGRNDWWSNARFGKRFGGRGQEQARKINQQLCRQTKERRL